MVITEGRPDETGLTMAQALSDMQVPVIAILDSAVAYALEAFRYAFHCSATHRVSVTCAAASSQAIEKRLFVDLEGRACVCSALSALFIPYFQGGHGPGWGRGSGGKRGCHQ